MGMEEDTMQSSSATVDDGAMLVHVSLRKRRANAPCRYLMLRQAECTQSQIVSWL